MLATTLPIGKSPEGLPIGAQLIGGFLQDRTTIALAGTLTGQMSAGPALQNAQQLTERVMTRAGSLMSG
jgi:amidase